MFHRIQDCIEIFAIGSGTNREKLKLCVERLAPINPKEWQDGRTKVLFESIFELLRSEPDRMSENDEKLLRLYGTQFSISRMSAHSIMECKKLIWSLYLHQQDIYYKGN